MDQGQTITLDALVPAEMAVRAEEMGVAKSRLAGPKLFVLAVLAGAFIALGADFSTTSIAGMAKSLPYGLVRLTAGVTFSLGLLLVAVGGAELFTGNNLIVMAWARGRVTTMALLRNWGVVYLGNFVGAAGIAALVFLAGQHQFGNGQVGATALSIANSKCNIGFGQAIVLGILCNLLVCLAVWLTMSARTTTDRLLCIVPPITAFVACGFEHSIANMYFVPLGLLIRDGASSSFWTMASLSPSQFSNLTLIDFLWRNLLPVTIGNLIGGVLLVGAVYWFVYLRDRGQQPPAQHN